MNIFIMQNSIVRPLGRDAQNALIGFEGENDARTFVIRTQDDIADYTVSLIIGEVDCGPMTKTTMPDGSTMLSLTLASNMLGVGGEKVCQLLMVKNTIVRKSSQFRAYVGESNDINSTAPDSATIIIISEKITELVREAALDAIEEVQEVIDSIPSDYSELSDQVEQNTEDIGGLKADLDELQDGGYVADQQKIQEKIDNWLEEHPEATTTVQNNSVTSAKLQDNVVETSKIHNGAVTDDKTADSYKNLFYDEVTVSSGRIANTDYYLANVPKLDSANNIIPVSLTYDNAHNLLEQAGENGSTLTINGYGSVLYNGESKNGIAICSGVVVNTRSYEGQAPDNMLYLGVKPDRSIIEYKMNSAITPARMLADGCTNVFNCYFKLVENGEIVSGLSGGTIVINGKTITEDLRNPLMLMGVKQNGDFVFMACDGRTSINDGLTYREGGEFLISQGCTTVYNLDGGGSTTFIFRGSKLNRNIDNDGTMIRNIRYALNVIKQSANTPTKGAYAKIGYEKQKIIEQIIPYVNSVNDSNITKIGAAIASGSDLNDITVEGKYYCPNSAVAQTLDNCPVTVGFSMYCLQQGGTGRAILQLLIKNPSSETGSQTIHYRTLIKDSDGALSTVYNWSQFSPTTESITLTPINDINVIRSICSKNGKTVTLSAVFTVNNDMPKNTTLFTVPETIRPSVTIDFLASDTTGVISLMSLTPNGNLIVANKTLPSGTHKMSTSWQVN